MTKEEIFNKLKGIVKPYVKNQEAFENLSERSDFLADLKINSANLVDIILDVEESFGIVIDNTSMQQMLNVEATLQIIETKLALQ
ncbi:MAG: acyl carrier protein [Flavobacterium sp.]|nr:MAG: acyl carrier protein [Flavobacterium sp.]